MIEPPPPAPFRAALEALPPDTFRILRQHYEREGHRPPA